MNRPIDARWLREMVQEVVRTPPVEVNWERIEMAVFSQLDRSIPNLLPKPLQKPQLSWPLDMKTATAAAVLVVASAAAAISAVAAGTQYALSGPQSGSQPSSQQKYLQPSLTEQLAQAEQSSNLVDHEASNTVGEPASEHTLTIIVAGDRHYAFEHSDWARFRLSPEGRIRLMAAGDSVSMHLLEGKIEADVENQGANRTVSVQAGSLLVTVRGTLFSVEARSKGVQVQVERGAVEVKSVSEAGEGWVVSGPSTRVFGLEPVRELENRSTVVDPISVDSEPLSEVQGEEKKPPQPYVAKTAPVALAVPAAEVVPEAVGTAVPESAAKGEVRALLSRDSPYPAASSLPGTLTPGLAAATLRQIAQEVTVCQRSAVPSKLDGVTITAQTKIVIRVAPDGHVIFARFDPPLQPKAQVCASGVVHGTMFPRTSGESMLELPLRW